MPSSTRERPACAGTGHLYLADEVGGARGSRWTALDLSPEGRSTDRAGDQTRRGRQRRGEGGVRGRVRFEWQIAATGERERERWARLGHGTCGLPPPHMTQPDATRPGPCRDRHRRSSRGRRSGARRCRLAPEERSRSWPCSRTEHLTTATNSRRLIDV